MSNLVKLYPVSASISIAAIFLFFLSSLRHLLYHSHALDLGFFDQGLYLISTGQKPIISLSGFHSMTRAKESKLFDLEYHQDEIYLFMKGK